MLIRRWLTSPHLRPIAFLASGSGIAQLIGVLATPVITRLYLPSEYGTLALYGAVVAIISAVAAGRYEGAVPLPPETEVGERDAVTLVGIAIGLAITTSLLVMIGITILIPFGLLSSLGGLGSWVYAIPVGVLASTLAATLSAYAIRRRRYTVLARIAPMQKTGSASIQVVGGLLHLGTPGLLLGALSTPIVGIGVLLRNYLEGRASVGMRGIDWKHARALARRYRDFPLVNTWFSLLNALGWNIQALAIARFYTVSDVGQYALASAMIGLPATLILDGVSQVYLRECAARAADPGGAVRLAKQTLKALTMASVPLFAALYLSTFFFEFIFGSKWVPTAPIAAAMIPLLWARFLTTSLTSVFVVYRRQGQLLAWQAFSLAITMTGFVVGGAMGYPIASTTLLVSLAVAPLYLALLPLIFRTIRIGPSDKLHSPE